MTADTAEAACGCHTLEFHLPHFKMKPLSTLEIRRYTRVGTAALEWTGSRLAVNEGSEMSIDLNQLRSLPVEEKLRLVELLWDDIGASDEPVILHPWQATEAGRRSGELKSDPSMAIDRDELWRRVNG